ncbi:MAG: ThiF family adenylyltransferase [Lautropia sp.]
MTEQPDRRFASTRQLLGDVAMRRLWGAHAVVVGIGGVGSWAAEALARSGVGRLTLIDLDQIVESNINRQLHALESTIGNAKVEVMAQRLQQIAPLAVVRAIEQFVEPDTVADLLPRDAAVVIDAIDAVPAKAALIACCVVRGVPVIACGAAGGRLDPLQLAADDLARTRGDALLAAVRTRLRRDYGFPSGAAVAATAAGKTAVKSATRAGARLPRRFGVTAIYSAEADPAAPPEAGEGARPGAPLACSGYGSIVTVTAAMGMAAAAEAIKAALGRGG